MQAIHSLQVMKNYGIYFNDMKCDFPTGNWSLVDAFLFIVFKGIR